MYVTGWKQKCDVWRRKQAWISGVNFDTASVLGFLEMWERRLMGLKYSLVFKKRNILRDFSYYNEFGQIFKTGDDGISEHIYAYN